MFEKKENNKKSLWNANTESNWIFSAQVGIKMFSFLCWNVVLFICVLYRFLDCICRKKRKVAVMTFYFLFCFESYFRNKLKHPSVGAGINFKSKYFAISRNSSVNLIQSFFSTVHKEFKFQELYASIQSHFIIQWHWNSMDIYNEHWFQFYTKYECQWLFKEFVDDKKNEHQRHQNKKRNLHTKDDISPCCALHGNGKKISRSLVNCSDISVCVSARSFSSH